MWLTVWKGLIQRICQAEWPAEKKGIKENEKQENNAMIGIGQCFSVKTCNVYGLS